jgi:hypothetical protein
MKQFLFYAALILAFIAIFVGVLVTTEASTNTRTRWIGVNVLAASFFFYLLSMAPFIHD